MRYPLEIGIGLFSISAHLLAETLAFVAGFRYFLYLKRKAYDPIPERNRIWIIIGAAFGAFLFSRLLGSLEDPEAWLRSNNFWLYFYSNKTIVGGLLGGLLFVEITKYFLREKSSSGDLFTYPLMLAMIIGRVGCFTAGVYEPTFGIPATVPWAMDLGDGIARHPIALYEIVFLAVLALLLLRVERNNLLKMGMRFKIFMISYLVFRFMMEYIKPVPHVLVTLSSIQIACLAGLLYYSRTLMIILYKPRKLIMNG